ncbi:ankyrin [Backusella circina FSU 941]|nr:ankyrin [Backusella circina FSU 941]
MVRLLLNHNANINAQGGNNMDTPLHDAVENNHCNVVELLLDHGADPFARNAQNAEPIDIAIEKKYDDIVLVLEARNPVSRKKKDGDTQQQKKNKKKSLVNKRKEKPDIETTSSSYTDVQPKKRRLVQAADLEKTKSPNEEEQEAKLEKDTKMDETKHGNAIVEKRKYKTKRKIKVDEEEEEEEEEVEQKVEKKKKEKVVKKKEEEKEVTVKIEPEEQRRYWNPRKQLHDTTTTTSTAAAAAAAMAAASGVAPADPHSPIPTPPPEFGMLMTSKQKEDALQYLPLYTVQLKSIFYVVDYQVSLLLGMNDSHQLWSTYPDLPKRLITLEEKTRLWSHLKTMLKQQDRQTFLDKPLYFTQLDDIVTLIKSNFNYLCSRLITITLDMGYQEKKNQDEKSLSLSKYRHSLPPKMRMKLGGYVNPSSPPPPSS